MDADILFGRPGRVKKYIRFAKGANCSMDINDVTYQINGAVFEVNRILGSGFLEKVYENALIVELRKRSLQVEAQVPIKVKYKGEVVGDYFADLIVEEQVIIELKTVENLQNIHEAQLINYLKATGIKIGLLVNFRGTKAEIKRMVLNLPEGHDNNHLAMSAR
jgi:GxxExxY protein